MKKKQIKNYLIFSLIIGVFLVLHLLKLTNLPVFADEAIYIRWAQLIIDDWQRYLFFPLNDGKTPLFIWLLVPWQLVVSNPLFAARILSVLIGLVQIIIMGRLAYLFTKDRRAQWLAMLLASLLPFFYFHHRMALMDGLLTLLLSVSFLFTAQISVKANNNRPLTLKQAVVAVGGSGLFFGLAMLTKIPALLYIPTVIIFIVTSQHSSLLKKFIMLTLASLTIFIGLVMFLLLKLHPAFGQLFNRGNDFLYSWQEIVIEGRWRDTLPSMNTYLNYVGHYLTWPILLLSVTGLLTTKKRTVLGLHAAWLAFAGPMFIMAKVLYPRYILPVSIFILLAAIISWHQLQKRGKWLKLMANALMVATIIRSSQFIYFNISDINYIPFVPADRVQYLTSWSAGFGVKPTVKLVQDIAQDNRVMVLSEGYFGTLPDGLLMYLHQEDVTNINITGIGYPIREIAPQYQEAANQYQQILLVGNSHRLIINLDQAQLLAEYCRPFNAPCHQVWDITALINK